MINGKKKYCFRETVNENGTLVPKDREIDVFQLQDENGKSLGAYLEDLENRVKNLENRAEKQDIKWGLVETFCKKQAGAILKRTQMKKNAELKGAKSK